MTKPDAAWLSVLSELLVNLAAGWFGAAVIVPQTVPAFSQTSTVVLLVNIGFGVFSLVIAYKLRTLYSES